MNSLEILVLYIYLFVLETLYIQYAYRKNYHDLSDRVHIMEIIKFASFTPFVIALMIAQNARDSVYSVFVYPLVALGIFAVGIFIKNFYKKNTRGAKILSVILLSNVVYLIIVWFFYDSFKHYINYFYFLTSSLSCLFYYFFVLTKEERKESTILYIITIGIGLSINFVFNDYGNPYGMLLKFMLGGFLFLCISVNLISQNIQGDLDKEKAVDLYYNELTYVEELLNNMADEDSLTGLKNMKALKKLVEEIKEDTSMNFTFILINIDNFKSINNFYGFIEGDQVLISFSEYLQNNIPKNSHVYRFAADQFGVVIDEDFDKVIDYVNNILHFTGSGRYNLEKYNLTCSMGISSFHGDKSFDVLYKECEVALMEAKKRGKNRYYIFENNLIAEVDKKLIMEKLIKKRIAGDEFIIYCQPKMSNENGIKRIAGGEILVRMKGFGDNFISPGVFIPLAEEIGIVSSIDDIVLKKSIDVIQQMEDMGFGIPLSINISSQGFLRNDFLENFYKLINTHNISNQNLIVEITETSLMSNLGAAISVARSLKEHGIALSLDDFGTGYSSLEYLIRLPVSQVKIDTKMMRQVMEGEKEKNFFKKIIELMEVLDLEVVVEGVEVPEQLELVQEAKVQYYQGFLEYRPMPINEFIELIKKQQQ